MRRCSCCGNRRKTVKALIIKSDTPPRMGLACRLCASCGVLVVPAVLKMLPQKPKKVPREKAVGMLRRHVADVRIPRRGDEMDDEDGSPLTAESDPDS